MRLWIVQLGESIARPTQPNLWEAPSGVPFEQRSLPASSVNRPYQEYEVLKPIPNVNSGTAAPWFGQPGSGTQYQLPISIDDLIQQGFIVPIFD
ncbi:TNT domain-containing protein [Aliiroseovarius crassostreae]|uniref:TNT domain-containing protein n=1 Tax=Aliiroseovarius crassostreae TaxID=154981 RepID=UPI0009E7AEE1